MIVDRRRTIIINQHRRADDRITKEQRQVIREKIDNLARWDSVAAEVYDPTDNSQRKKYFMRKRWAELHDRFKIRSYLQIEQKYYQKVITWLDQAMQKELDKLDELDSFKKPGRQKGKSTLVCLVLAAMILLFPLTVTQVPPRVPPIAKLQPALATPDDTPIQPAVLVDGSTPMVRAPDLPGFHFYAGCSALRPTRPVFPTVKNGPSHEI